MPKKGGNISLSSYDDIFQTDQSREEDQQERVQEIPLSELHPFKGHPFKVLDDEDMMNLFQFNPHLVQSAKQSIATTCIRQKDFFSILYCKAGVI